MAKIETIEVEDIRILTQQHKLIAGEDFVTLNGNEFRVQGNLRYISYDSMSFENYGQHPYIFIISPRTGRVGIFKFDVSVIYANSHYRMVMPTNINQFQRESDGLYALTAILPVK